MKKILLTTFILVVTFSANAQSWSEKKIKGNGNLTTENRKIDKFNQVNVGGSFDVLLIEGKEGKVTLEGEKNILDYIITEVKGDILYIKFKENTTIKTTKKLVATIPFRDIDGISLGGSGNILVKKTIKATNVSFSIGGSGNITATVNSNSLKSSIGGSGDIRLSGKTDNFKCSIAGSGNIKAYKLETNNLKASIAGSGSVKTTVNSKIKASVVGSGNIYYKGNPKHTDINSIGSGDVINKN